MEELRNAVRLHNSLGAQRDEGLIEVACGKRTSEGRKSFRLLRARERRGGWKIGEEPGGLRGGGMQKEEVGGYLSKQDADASKKKKNKKRFLRPEEIRDDYRRRAGDRPLKVNNTGGGSITAIEKETGN